MPKIIVEGDGVFFAASGQRLTAGEYETTDPTLIASALSVDLDWVHVLSDDGLTVTEVPVVPTEEPPTTAKVAEAPKPDTSGPLTAADFGAAEKKAAAANDSRPPRPAPPPEVK